MLKGWQIIPATHNLCTDIFGKNSHKEFAEMFWRHVSSESGLSAKPFSNMDLKVLDVVARREGMERSDTLNVNLKTTTLVFEEQFSPEFESISRFAGCKCNTAWVHGISHNSAPK